MRWPNGAREVVRNVAVDQYVTRVEGENLLPALSRGGLALLAAGLAWAARRALRQRA